MGGEESTQSWEASPTSCFPPSPFSWGSSLHNCLGSRTADLINSEREIRTSPCVLNRAEIYIDKGLSGEERRSRVGSFSTSQTSWAASGCFNLKSTTMILSFYTSIAPWQLIWVAFIPSMNYLRVSIDFVTATVTGLALPTGLLFSLLCWWLTKDLGGNPWEASKQGYALGHWRKSPLEGPTKLPFWPWIKVGRK